LYTFLSNDGKPCYFASNNAQALISSGGNGYLVQGLNTGAIDISVAGGFFFGASMVAYLDDFFIALTPRSRQFQISGINDGTSWNPLDVAINGGSADDLVGLITDHEYLYLFGNRRASVWYNNGAADFPFTPVSGAFMEQGCVAPASIARIDNSVAWLGQDENGANVLWKAHGFIPARISNHAIEAAWSQYSTTADAIAMVVQRNGHTEYRITFPSGDATWVYDVSTGMWHERATFDLPRGVQHAQNQRYHCYSNGVHYVLGLDGIIYKEADGIYDDAGVPIRRIRVAPVLADENKRVLFHRLQIDLQPGIGLDGAPPVGVDPQLMLRYSNDSARTWSSEMMVSAGKIGDTEHRVIFNRLGSGRRRVFEVSTSDPANWVLIAAYLEITQGAH
ncbi:MAG TPA: hypothetical protein DEQ40_19160, partial [Oxalobacteraceae bacterium]|nr:hypothetical protein [Oxalobacteraceae bacterium]